MVAAVEKTSVRQRNSPKGKMFGKIDLLTRAQARNLYVVRQLSAPEVATQTGLTPRQIYDLAEREGWSKTRAELKRKTSEALQAREQADIEEYVEAVAIKTKVLGLGTLDEAISELKGGGEFKAKNLQALSVAARNFNGIYREAKQLDASDARGGGGNTTNNVSLFFMPASALLKPDAGPRNVTPNTQAQGAATDIVVSASPVTESAKPNPLP